MNAELLQILINIIGIIMVFSGILDAVKYHWQARAIRHVGIAKGHSRKFINAALFNDIVKIIYLVLVGMLLKCDWYLLISALLAIVFMLELWITIYNYYPYRMRGCCNFKKPNIIIYFINSLTPNKLRKKL